MDSCRASCLSFELLMLRMLNQQGSHWTIACWNDWTHQRYADEPLTEASYHPATWGFFKVLKEEREEIPKILFGGFYFCSFKISVRTNQMASFDVISLWSVARSRICSIQTPWK